MFDIKTIKIPHSPGVYIMKDRSGIVIYIGKAKNLPSRVRSYFNKTITEMKTLEMVEKIHSIDFIVTDNEVEALLLEARMIRQHKPKYNIMLKDNAPYMYIKITNEKYPQLISTRLIENDGGKYFGPFVYGKGRKNLVLTTARLFGLRTGKFLSSSSRELYQLLSNIQEVNLENIPQSKYKKNVKLAEMFLKGKKEKLLDELKKRMEISAEKENYELASLYKKQISSIQHLSDKQLVSLPKHYDQDIVNYVIVDNEIMVQIFNVSKGVISSKNEFTISNNDKVDVISIFIKQYYLTRSIPKEIIIPNIIYEQVLVNKYLNEIKGQKVIITIPKKGDKLKLLELVKKNILIRVRGEASKELMNILNLEKIPIDIDGFDISNLSGQMAVGSCVRFSKEKSDKKLYRRFKIKTVIGSDDFASMYEVLSRRYSHSEWKEPDLILIDGGLGQLMMAKKALDKLKLNIPVISLAKKQEEIFQVNSSKSIKLNKRSKALKLLQSIRDESHRFAIFYHRVLRAKREK